MTTRIEERIRKLELLASRNPNPYEALAARQKADELRAKLPKAPKPPRPKTGYDLLRDVQEHHRKAHEAYVEMLKQKLREKGWTPGGPSEHDD